VIKTSDQLKRDGPNNGHGDVIAMTLREIERVARHPCRERTGFSPSAMAARYRV
jgi:hypothetical protein